MTLTSVPRRAVTVGAFLLILATPVAAHGTPMGRGTGTTAPPSGTDADFCLDTPPGVPVNEFNCPVTTTTSAPTTPKPRSAEPRVRATPRYTG